MNREDLLHRFLLHRTAGRGRWHVVLLLLALILFVGGALIAWWRLPTGRGPVKPWLLWLVAFPGVPVTALLTACEYWLSAALLGASMRFDEALLVSVSGTAANLLPIPGAAAVRIQAMKIRGITYRGASSVAVAVGLTWVGLAALGAGIVLLASTTIAIPFLVAGGGAVAVGLFTTLRLASHPGRHWLAAGIVAVEVASIAADACRLYLTLIGIGYLPTPAQAVVFAFSGVLASAAGIFPGGLGLREWLASAMAPLVGLSASVGFIATATNRLVGTAMHIPIGVGLLVVRRLSSR